MPHSPKRETKPAGAQQKRANVKRNALLQSNTCFFLEGLYLFRTRSLGVAVSRLLLVSEERITDANQEQRGKKTMIFKAKLPTHQ